MRVIRLSDLEIAPMDRELAADGTVWSTPSYRPYGFRAGDEIARSKRVEALCEKYAKAGDPDNESGSGRRKKKGASVPRSR